jgi:branched-chain amino acid transport system ATP-binding protein
MTLILEIDNVTKTFEGLKAIDACSMTVQKGTVTGLIGPNGAGKTTLFNLITGFLRPTLGRITFLGRRIDGLAPHRVFRKGIARTYQIPRPLASMSVIENLMLIPPGQFEAVWDGWLRTGQVGRKEAHIYRKAEETLEFVGLGHLKNASAGHLSEGQKKLVELARTFMCDPHLILLDEPGAGVAPPLAKQLMAGVQRRRQEQGTTFLVIEHDMDIVAQNCDPVIVMSNGRKLIEGSVSEVRRDERVLEAYFGA